MDIELVRNTKGDLKRLGRSKGADVSEARMKMRDENGQVFSQQNMVVAGKESTVQRSQAESNLF